MLLVIGHASRVQEQRWAVIGNLTGSYSGYQQICTLPGYQRILHTAASCKLHHGMHRCQTMHLSNAACGVLLTCAKRSGAKCARRGSSTMTALLISFSLESLKRSTVSTTSLYLCQQGQCSYG
jgi:hypothetical protein